MKPAVDKGDKKFQVLLAFMKTPHGEIDVRRWLGEKQNELDGNNPGQVIAAMKTKAFNDPFFGPETHRTLSLLAANLGYVGPEV